MKKLLALAIAVLVLGMTGASVMAQQAQQVGAQNMARAKIRTLGTLGSGLAVSQSDPMDFELIRVGIAGVRLTVSDAEEDMNVGLLYFGEDKYRLREVVIGNGTVSASIYLNDTNVGSLNLDSYPKGDTEIWAGPLSLEGAEYNAYVVQVRRMLKAAEKAENVKDYCTNNPERCMAAMKAVGQIICDPATDGNCRERLKSFCEQYPEDNRCKAVSLAYCATHLNDSMCRNEIMERCRANTDDENCERLVSVYENRVEKAQEIMEKAPAWVQTVRQKIQAKADSLVAAAKKIQRAPNSVLGGNST
jgi:hypothetical protein